MFLSSFSTVVIDDQIPPELFSIIIRTPAKAAYMRPEKFFQCMNLNNANKIFCFLYKKHHPDQVVLPMKDGINNLVQSLLQRGNTMKKEDMVYHQVLQRTLVLLLLQMVVQSARIQVGNHSFLVHPPMEVEQFILIFPITNF
jgi:hypothetical protein